MIDTIKVGIPLSSNQLSKLLKLVAEGDQWQWVQFHPQSGNLRFLRLKGVAEVDQNSFHRKIHWDIPDSCDSNEAFLTVELSLPKFIYGHNIHLLYGWIDALKDLKRQFERELHCRLRSVAEWRIRRLDICYSWRCPSQDTAQNLLDSLKRLRYPRKEPTIRPEAVFFKGNTYSFKVYLKLPEFRVHDMKELIKGKANLEWVNHLENLATGVIRVEATLRQKYLERKNIRTVADLAKPVMWAEWYLDGEFISPNAEIIKHALLTVTATKKVDLRKNKGFGGEVFFEDGEKVTLPAGNIDCSGHNVYFPGGGFTIRKLDNPTDILQYFLAKFIGENRGMDEAGQVKTKLLEKYNSRKAIVLLGFWLHVQKFGAEDAKLIYAKRSFYRNKADLKAAGVSLLEPVLRVELDKQFVETFRFEVPSNHVTNRFDDFKDSGNLLNEGPDNVET